jgi:hypothetical protein
MADFHALRTSDAGDSVTVAFHVPVPAETNQAGKSLSSCVVEDLAPVSDCDWLLQAELDEVATGTVYEHVEVVQMSGKVSNGQRLAVVQARAAELVPEIQDRIRSRYRFWGYNGSIA